LRELVSNANDAIQKAKIMAAQDTSYLWDETDFAITLQTDEDKSILTIIDNWVWMSSKDVQSHIWTIAKSGTKSFLEAMKQVKKDEKEKIWSDLIGQFGIGFYSAFMVAERIELETKAVWEDAVLRTSEWKWDYTITDSKKTTRWTEIRLYLNEESKEFASPSRIKWLVRKHSNYVPVPVMMMEDAKTDKDGKPTDEKRELEQVNAMQSLRTKHKKDVTAEDYKDFYQSLTFDNNDPLDVLHVHTEWVLSYKTLLFVPQKQNPFAMMQWWDNQQEYWPDLYVQNVLILEKCKELLPIWLRFVKWVVETNDLSLNVSREILQNSALMTKLQASLVKEVLKSLARKKKKEPEAFLEFHQNYGRILKEWIHYDFANKEKIAETVLFYSMNQKKYISLDDYIAANTDTKVEDKKDDKKDDKKIDKKDWSDSEDTPANFLYYLPWTSIQELENSPYIEQFKKYGTDVLLMIDPIDEYVVSGLQEYKGRKFKAASEQDVQLGDKEEQAKADKEIKKQTNEHKDFLAFVKKTVWEDVLEDVTLTTTLQDALAVVVTKEWQPSAQMQKIMKSMWQAMPAAKKTLQINASHPLAIKMMDTYKQDTSSDSVKDMAMYLYEQAVMLEWWEIKDLTLFIKRVNQLLK